MSLDEKLISAYIDNEVSSPWKEELEKELEQSPEDQRLLDQYRSLQTLFKNDLDVPDTAQSKERVYHRIKEKIERKRNKKPILKRKLNIPLPLAAAAAAAIIFLAGALSYSLLSRQKADDYISLGEGRSLNLTIKVEDVEQLMDVLYSRDMLREITIELPDSPQFQILGEPKLLKATEFSGNTRE